MTIFYYYTPNWWFNVVFASFIPLAISTVCLKSYLVETPQFLIGVDKDFGSAVTSLQTISKKNGVSKLKFEKAMKMSPKAL